jgi:hypothetical protein
MMPKPIKEPFHRIMSTARGILVRLGVFDLEFFEKLASALSQSLSEGMKRDKRSIFPSDGHVVAHGG